MMEKTGILQCAQEYNYLVEKVNVNLKSLKTELLAMKKQDVNLLKQLIHISDVIQTICQKQHTPSPDSAVDESPTETFHKTKRAPLVRQQSVPYYITVLRAQSSSFNSSFEGINEIPEDETDSCSNDDSDSLLSVSMNGNYSAVPLYVQRANRPRSLSYEEPVGGTSHGSIVGLDDSFFESVLQKNIALWKSETQSDKTKIYNGDNAIET